jgi:hypothetical protein
MSEDTISIADILGPWVDPDWESSLVHRCREAWNKPLKDLSREELATLLRQKLATKQLLPVAKRKLLEVNDETEMFDGELDEAIKYASKTG